MIDAFENIYGWLEDATRSKIYSIESYMTK